MLSDLSYTHDAPIYYEEILKRRLAPGHRQRIERAAAAMDVLPIIAEEQRDLTLAEICSRSRKMANEFDRKGKKLSVIVVDHMGLVLPSSRYKGNRVNEVTEISNGLATLAKDLDCAVIALCQLNRGVEGRENKRPGMADLRDSGAIEQDASLLLFSYRPAYYLRDRLDDPSAEHARQMALSACRNKLEIIVAKQRNGKLATIDCFVDIGANAIRNASYR
jgi:replicative DNA helicase